ncbi:MAG: serine/threonine-protein kinase [Paracoccaceae bacterium]
MAHANIDYDHQPSEQGLPNGTTLSGDQFEITHRLSAGGFGVTYLAKDVVLNRTIVIKECFPEELCMRVGNEVVVRNAQQAKLFTAIVDMFMHEARSLAKLRHPNIVGVHRAFEENETAYMALDLIDGLDLLDVLEGNRDALPTPARLKGILLELLDAIETIHKNDLLHRDISPDNIIIDKAGTPVLIDFGAARAEASRRTRAVSAVVVVKDGYSPQEFYVSGSIQTPSSDLYALAATFYHLISGEAPTNSQIRMAELVAKNPDPCVPLAGRIDGFEPAFLEAIDKAMEVVPKNRLQSAAEWRELISKTTPNVVAPFAVADADADADETPKQTTQNFDRILTRIIEETNADVEVAKPVASKDIKTRVLEPKEPTKPDWVDEFNASFLEEDVTSDEVEDEPEEDEPEEDYPVEVLPDRPVVQTQMAAPQPVAKYQEEDWASRVLEKNARARELYEQEKLNEAASRGPHLQSKLKSALLAKDDPRLSGTSYEGSRMIEPLVKYLATGIVVGLALFLFYQVLV